MRSQPDSHVLAPALSGPKSVCISKVDSLDSKWCQANCEATPGTNLCKAACTCSAAAREPKAEAKTEAKAEAPDATETAADEAPGEVHGCRSHTDTVTDEWCGLTCAATPDTDDCVANCRCPGWQKNGAVARQKVEKVEKATKGHCAALQDAMTAAWCDGTCLNTPNADQCWEACDCPGRKKMDPREARQRDEKREKGITGHCKPIGSLVSAGWCDGSCLNTPNAEQCYDVCECPGKKKNRPVEPSPLPEKTVCKSKVESVADEWCDQTCIKTPNDKSCTATCHCPGWREALKEDPAPEPGPCTSGIAHVPASWCDSNCRETPGADECMAACKCPALAPSPSPEAGEASTSTSTCRSVVDTATGEWCDGNCKRDPNAEWCEPACRCPGYNATLAEQRIAKRGHNCTGIIDTASGNWCDELPLTLALTLTPHPSPLTPHPSPLTLTPHILPLTSCASIPSASPGCGCSRRPTTRSRSGQRTWEG